MESLKALIEVIEKDGLFNTKKGYNIKVKDGELYINGNKQPKETYEKYKQFYPKEKFSFKGNGENTYSL